MPETGNAPSKPSKKPQKKFNKGGKPNTKRPKKDKAKKEQAPVEVAAKFFTPVFLYTSKCCGAASKKEPLVWSPKDKEDNKFSENHKGHFRCTACGKSCSVTRERNREGVQIAL